ncbi:hypothetical protein PENSPDRAFT_662516 [Peniophora sp. CONT]|nr:hypothetical protein PENSPDRAFT_662516 [Peniophora sp. CONT]
MAAISYSVEEAREILLDQSITLEAHIYLEGRREEYVRAEDYERPDIILSSFRHIWSSAHPDWDWEKEEEEEGEGDMDYYRQRELKELQATYHWFRSNTRIRGGFKGLPHDVDKTKWTAEDVCGAIYKSAILEWVEAKSGFIPGRADGFLAEYRRARARIYKCLNADQVRACQRTADEWNGASVPHHIQVQNFNNKFASVCRAFTSMLIKDHGVFPFIFYIGVPGHDVPAGIYEVMRKEGLAAQTFRSFTKLDNVFQDMRTYVNMNIDMMYRSEAKIPPPVRSAQHLRAPEYEFRKADVIGGRVYLSEERLKDGWEDNSSHLFYQLVQFCHSSITNSKQTPPPWKALSEDPSRLIVPECLPGHPNRFGASPEKTLRDHRNAFIRHWFSQVGYLEFHHRFVKGGTFAEPEEEPWHALKKYDEDFTGQWLSNERTERGQRSTAPRTSAGLNARVKFGSDGPLVKLNSGSPYTRWIVPDQATWCDAKLDDPDDRLPVNQPQYHPGRPSWPAPCLLPDTMYARLQWGSQILEETGGMAATTLLDALKWLAQLPPVANYDYDIKFFRREPGKDRTWVIDSLPDWVTWGLDRCYVASQAEIDSLSAFLRVRAWSFLHEGKTRFAGVEMAWTIGLAAVLYTRALRHAEELSVRPPSRWSLSGGPEWQKQVRSYQFDLDNDDLRDIIRDFKCYMEDLALSLSVSGLPPSLLYCCHNSREHYVQTLASQATPLTELCQQVFAMPADGPAEYPSLPVFTGRRVWQQPQLGIPRSVYKEHLRAEVLSDAFSNPHIFLTSAGSSRGREAGLSALLEMLMVWTELTRLSSDTQGLPAYLRASGLTSPEVTEPLKESLLSAAAAHRLALGRVLPSGGAASNSPKSRERSGRDLADSDAISALDRHDIDIMGELRAQRRDIDGDVLSSRLRASAVQEAERQGRWKLNEQQRKDQNALNLAAHHVIHPVKPPPNPLVLPDLQDLHQDLLYSPSQPPEFIAPAAKSKRVVRTTAGRHRAVAGATDVGKAPGDATRSQLQRSSAVKRVAFRSPDPKRRGTGGTKKRPAEDDLGQLSSKNRRLARPPDIEEEQESFDLRAIEGSDSDIDSILPATISVPKVSRALPPRHNAIEKRTTVSRPRMASPGKEISESYPPAERSSAEKVPSGYSRDDEEDTMTDRSATSHSVPRPRPLPRRKDPSNPSKPGISTAFGSDL